ncbi:MAG: hypothetical protein Q8K60_09020 [Parachlamydiaceae bacterium]|nr:hypothetical protein [Parachlamydiaceae bacterium]
MISLTRCYTNIVNSHQSQNQIKSSPKYTKLGLIFESALIISSGYTANQLSNLKRFSILTNSLIGFGAFLAVEMIFLSMIKLFNLLKKLNKNSCISYDNKSLDLIKIDHDSTKDMSLFKFQILDQKNELTREKIAEITLPLKNTYETTRFNDIYKNYDSIEYNLFGPVEHTPNNFGFQGTGMALLVHKKEKKYNFNDRVKVPHSDSILFNAIKKISTSNEKYFNAFIVTMIMTETDRNDNSSKTYNHKFCIGIQKNEKNLNIIFFESQGGVGVSDNKEEIINHSNDNIKTEENTNEAKLINFLNDSPLNYKYIIPIFNQFNDLNLELQLNLYTSKVQREKASGCAVFAMQDARNFINDPQFFDNIMKSGKIKTVSMEIKSKTLDIYEVHQLQPEYMIGAQSMKLIDTYIKENPKILNQTVPGRKKTFNEYLNKYTRIVNDKKQNHYTTFKTTSYIETVVNLANKLDVNELFQRITSKYLQY